MPDRGIVLACFIAPHRLHRFTGGKGPDWLFLRREDNLEMKVGSAAQSAGHADGVDPR